MPTLEAGRLGSSIRLWRAASKRVFDPAFNYPVASFEMYAVKHIDAELRVSSEGRAETRRLPSVWETPCDYHPFLLSSLPRSVQAVILSTWL